MEISHKIFAYILVFILCWTIEWIIWILGLAINQPLPYWSLLIYATLPHAQGFLNSIVYGFSISTIHRQYAKQHWAVVVLLIIFSPILLWVWFLPRWVIKKCTEANLELSEQLITNQH